MASIHLHLVPTFGVVSKGTAWGWRLRESQRSPCREGLCLGERGLGDQGTGCQSLWVDLAPGLLHPPASSLDFDRFRLSATGSAFPFHKFRNTPVSQIPAPATHPLSAL